MLLLPPFTSGRFELILEMFSLQAETVNGLIGPSYCPGRVLQRSGDDVLKVRNISSVLLVP